MASSVENSNCFHSPPSWKNPLTGYHSCYAQQAGQQLFAHISTHERAGFESAIALLCHRRVFVHLRGEQPVHRPEICRREGIEIRNPLHHCGGSKKPKTSVVSRRPLEEIELYLGSTRVIILNMRGIPLLESIFSCLRIHV